MCAVSVRGRGRGIVARAPGAGAVGPQWVLQRGHARRRHLRWLLRGHPHRSAAMPDRPLPSIPRDPYSSVAESRDRRGRLWPAAGWLAPLLPCRRTDPRFPWHEEVSISDAALSDITVGTRGADLLKGDLLGAKMMLYATLARGQCTRDMSRSRCERPPKTDQSRCRRAGAFHPARPRRNSLSASPTLRTPGRNTCRTCQCRRRPVFAACWGSIRTDRARRCLNPMPRCVSVISTHRGQVQFWVIGCFRLPAQALVARRECTQWQSDHGGRAEQLMAWVIWKKQSCGQRWRTGGW